MYMAIPSTIQKLALRPTSGATGRDSWNNWCVASWYIVRSSLSLPAKKYARPGLSR